MVRIRLTGCSQRKATRLAVLGDWETGGTTSATLVALDPLQLNGGVGFDALGALADQRELERMKAQVRRVK